MGDDRVGPSRPGIVSDSAGDDRITVADCLNPRHWPTWVGLGVLRVLVLLPWPVQMRLGRGLGRALYHVIPARREVAAANVRHCLPEVDDAACQRIVRQQFDNIGMGLFETAATWWRPTAQIEQRCELVDRENLDTALADGHGVLVLTPHYTALDIGCLGVARRIGLCGTYDPPKNPIIGKLLLKGRRRYCETLFDSGDIRGMIRTLSANQALFFAPDQGVRRKRAGVNVPFFGFDTLTTPATSRLARVTGARVVMMLPLRRADDRGYQVRLLPPLRDFPSDDAKADTARINAWLADNICQHNPEQYFWLHQRFKRGAHRRIQLPFTSCLACPPGRYRALSLLLAPVFALHIQWRAVHDGGRCYRRQRGGRDLHDLPRGALWVHAASVGEVITVLPLLERLATECSAPLLLSTNTPTGRAIAEQRVPTGTAVCYLPVDRPGPARRFVHTLAPRAALIAETELWPWLYAKLEHAGVPIVIVNGRLSAKSREAPHWLRPALKFCLQRCCRIIARYEDDAAAFRALGAPPHIVQVAGNLKYAAQRQPPTAVDLGRAYVLLASSHDDEEAQLLRAWQRYGAARYLPAIAPRHPERGAHIEQRLTALGASVARRSRGDPVTERTDVYLADTMGELEALMAGAEIVIMGGSFIPHGGQNLLEPARLGRATIVGPHMDNFRAETDRLATAGGIVECRDMAAAVERCSAFLADPDARDALGQRARDAAAASDTLVGDYMAAIQDALAECDAATRSAS